MVIVSASEVSRSFGVREVLKDVSFSIESGEKIGVLGVNGAGKTTLFSLISGEDEPDSGSIYISKNTRVAYMHQHAEFTSEKTAVEEVLESFSDLIDKEESLQKLEKQFQNDHSLELIQKYHTLQESFVSEGGLTFRARIKSALSELGFSDEEMYLPLSSISGGQRTRALIAKLMLSGAELLLLDEPTNHLDIRAVSWMETFLSEYRGTVLVISHDRFFLDKVTNSTFEIENARLKRYNGNYTGYVEEKAKAREAERRVYEQKMREIEHLKGIIEQQKRWNREKNLVTARSKQKALDKIEETLEKPEEDPEEIKFRFRPLHGAAGEVLSVEGVSKSYNGSALFSDVNMLVKRGEHVFIVGDNGCGKTTLMRIIIHAVAPDTGESSFGPRVVPGYFDQAQSDVLPEKSILDIVYDAVPEYSLGQVRSALASFLFKGDDVYKKAGELSGGERARVALCRLMLSKCNLLLLDEPTNHLDIPSKEALESALMDYEGTMVVISHDRYLINKLAQRIYAFENGRLVPYPGNYDYYAEHRQEQKPVAKTEKASAASNEYFDKKERLSAIRKLRTAVERAQARIDEIDSEISQLNSVLSDSSAGYEVLMETTDKIARLEEEQTDLLAKWEEASEKLEKIENE